MEERHDRASVCRPRILAAPATEKSLHCCGFLGCVPFRRIILVQTNTETDSRGLAILCVQHKFNRSGASQMSSTSAVRLPLQSRPSAPCVTVAIPSYNHGRFLEATLRSVFAQSVPVEVMLADGGSTDDTLRIVEHWQDRLRWFRTRRDTGQASAINEAISHGRAPLVCWLNSDDLLLPGGLSALVEAIETDVSATVAYGGCLRIDDQGWVIGKYRVEPLTTRRLSRGCVIAQPGTIIRREAWEQVGELDESLHLSHDYDLWWRLHRTGARFKRIGVDVAAARLHPAAKTIKYASEMYAEAELIVRRHYGPPPIIWWLRKPFSIRMRKEGSILQKLAERWRSWRRTSTLPHKLS